MNKYKPSGRLPILYAVMVFFLLVLFVATFGSCYTQNKAQQQTAKALATYPSIVADIARTAFPCVTTKADTIITTQDSLIYIDCPDNTVVTAADYTGPDTVTRIIRLPGSVRTVRVPVTLPVKTVTIVQKVDDSAKIYTMQAATLKLQSDNDKLRGKVHSRNTWLKWLIIALLISAGLNFIQFKLNGLPKIKR